MSGKEDFLEILFRPHSNDLISYDPKCANQFVCPICLRIFSLDDIASGVLSDGHIWPDAIREKSGTEKTILQRVLLCTECNNRAGSRGDKQMQLRELAKDAEKKGELFGERRIQVVRGLAEKPIQLRAQVRIEQKETIKGQIVFQFDKVNEWARNNPKEREKFKALGRDNSFSLIVYPFHEMKPYLAEVGWITSAYLLAFYTFGYRYILNKDMNIVRDYISKSFTNAPDPRPELDDFGMQECNIHYSQEPEIGLVIPLDGKVGVHLEISLFDCHIRLPFHHFIPSTLSILIQCNEEISKEMPKLIEKKAKLYISVKCTKMDGHDCLWDYVLGKPIPVDS